MYTKVGLFISIPSTITHLSLLIHFISISVGCIKTTVTLNPQANVEKNVEKSVELTL